MFQPKSLDKILASFRQTITDLNDLQNHHAGHITSKLDLINDLEAEIKAHNIEQQKATTIQGNLEKLLLV